ncbi:MAG: MurR/RpiR family transcriptional regulator [Acidimicrobiia bacterium]
MVRFCQDIGLRGFADLKIRLAAESIPADRGSSKTSPRTMTPPPCWARCSELLRRAEHVLFVGVGTSAEAPHDAHVQHVAAHLLRKGALCFALSHTGQTRETLAAVTAANAAHVSTIAVTSFYRSPFTKLVDVALVAGSRETDFRIEAMTSRIAHTAVLDALYVAVCLRDMERTRRGQQLTADTLTEHRI